MYTLKFFFLQNANVFAYSREVKFEATYWRSEDISAYLIRRVQHESRDVCKRCDHPRMSGDGCM